jgi:hypothetical protein
LAGTLQSSFIESVWYLYYPFVAQDSQDVQRKLDFVDVISNLSLTLGDSSNHGYKRQLMSSSCCRKEPSIDFKEDKENKTKQVLPNEDNEFKDMPAFRSKVTSKVTSVLTKEKT